MVNTKDIHLPKKHPCTVCKKLFVAASSLERHILTHSGKRPFECKQCQWSFTQPAHLKRHTATIHTGDLELYNCLYCNKSFKSNYHLKRHMLVHSREKPYKCTSCSHSSTTAQSLDFHVMTHTGERPFKCSLCNMSFKQPTHVNKHMLTHGKQKL